MYNAELQCRLQFGINAQVCSQLTEICSRLWCELNNTCTSQLRPAAPGTQCGKHMVLIKFIKMSNFLIVFVVVSGTKMCSNRRASCGNRWGLGRMERLE